MVNTYYDPGQQRGARVKELFTRIAPRYDLINDLQSFGLHRHWKHRVINMAKPKPNERALDLCCGTGDLTLMLAHRGADVVAVDFSDRMLQVAQRRTLQSRCSKREGQSPNARHAACHTPSFIQADALQMPFPTNSFDVVTVAYGLRNLSDIGAGLREMMRVASPGARLLVLDFGKPDNSIWRRLYFAYLKFFVPMLGRIFCGNASAYAYILESLKNYPAQRGVAARMGDLGLVNVRIVNLIGGIMSINYAEKKR
jgi:ubiquinone/menaquinone biosynthesis methyltransferase